MSEENNQPAEKRKPRYDREQCKMLLRCSEKADITEWNTWRKEHRKEEIFLEGANLGGAYLEGASLGGAHLEGANLFNAHLKGAYLGWAHLEDAYLRGAHLEDADLKNAHLEGADF